jgi:acetyl esterase/lipase
MMVFIHGGGFVMSSAREYRMLTWRLSAWTESPVLAVDYGLAPEYCFPIALEEVIQVYSHLVSETPGREISLCGDSAGAGLATALALYLSDLARSDPGLALPKPSSLVLFSPWLDLTHSQPSFFLNSAYDWLPGESWDASMVSHETEPRHYYTLSGDTELDSQPYVSPLFAFLESLSDLPPTLIQVGSAERLRDEGLAFALKARKAGANNKVRCEVYDGRLHAFHCMAPYGDVAAKVALQRAAEFIKGVEDEGFAFFSGKEFRDERFLTDEEVSRLLEEAGKEAAKLR